MLLIYLILGSVMMFQSGCWWAEYKLDSIEGKPAGKSLAWCIGMGLFSLYFLISMVGRAAQV